MHGDNTKKEKTMGSKKVGNSSRPPKGPTKIKQDDAEYQISQEEQRKIIAYLYGLAKPIQGWLKTHGDPYVELVVNTQGVYLKTSTMGINNMDEFEKEMEAGKEENGGSKEG